jgi:hypothetical protein
MDKKSATVLESKALFFCLSPIDVGVSFSAGTVIRSPSNELLPYYIIKGSSPAAHLQNNGPALPITSSCPHKQNQQTQPLFAEPLHRKL